MQKFVLTLALPLMLVADHTGHSDKDAKPAMLMPGFGKVNHKITTKSEDAQRFFNQGLSLVFGFNHEEAIRSFRQASALDPDCAMAYWGIGLSLGSNYNDPEPEAERLHKAYLATRQALELSAKVTEQEQAYIRALAKRYSPDPEADREKLKIAYKDAMADLSKRYPDDLDAATLYAESYMNLRPWNLYSIDGQPQEGTDLIVATLEGVLERDPGHLGANHYYVHAIEASKTPERGLDAAKRLETLAPKSGHLAHMPAHIYHRTGDYEKSARANIAGAEADREYIQKTGATGMYPMMYFAHNLHFLSIDRAMQNNYPAAKKAAAELIELLGNTAVEMPMVEFFMPTREMIAVKLRRWDDVIALPEPNTKLVTTHALWHFARGMALHGKNRIGESRKAYDSLVREAAAIPEDAPFGLNKSRNVLKLAALVLEARLQPDRAEDLLTEAIAIEDKLSYEEPPIWYLPTRESLGALLLRQGRAAEAEAVFRKDLQDNRNSGRSLFGLAKALEAQNKKAEAANVKGAHKKLTVDQL